MRISIISRYMATTLLTFFAGALFVLTFIFFMMHFIKLFNMAMFYGADILWVFSTLLKTMPDVLSLCAPMAFQLGVLLTLTSMSEHGEIIALRAAGFSFKEITKPLFLTAAFLSVILLLFTNYFTPKNTKQFLDARTNITGRIAKVILEPKTFMEIGDWSLYAENIYDEQTMTGVHLVNKEDKDSLSTKINALTGKVHLTQNNIGLQLFDGQMQRVSAKDARDIVVANFKKYNVTFPLVAEKKRSEKTSELTTAQIFHRLYKTGGAGPDEQTRNEYKTEFSTRQVLALSPLVLAFLSCPLVFSFGKNKNKAWGMLWSVVIILCFYGLMTGGVSIGKKQAWFAYAGPWMPIVLGYAAGYYLWKKRLKR